jgi:hypothetical protein
MSGVDASPGGGTTINFPGPPAFEQHVTTHGLEYGTLSPEQQQNFNERGDLERQQADTIERQRQQQNQFDTIDRQHKEQAAQAMQAIEDEKARQDVKLQENIAAHQNRLEQAYKEGREQPSAALFADAKTGERAKKSFGLMMAGLGDALAAYGAARTGRGAPTNSFGEIVDYDLQRQRDKIAKLKDNVLMAQTGVKDATQAREIAMAALDAKGAGFMKRLESFAEARMAAAKEGDQNWINAQKALTAAKEERLKYQQQSLAPLTVKHQGPTVENTMRDTKAPTGKDEKDIVMGDPLNPAEAGKPLGEVTTGRGGAQAFSQTDTGIHTAIDALKALQADIAKNGERPTSLADLKRRDALRANATLQVGAVSTAGQSDLALSTEAATIGAKHNPVLQWAAGENPGAIAAKIHELETRVVRNRAQGLLPLTEAGKASLAARQAPAPGAIPLIVPAAPGTSKNDVPPAGASAAPPSPRDQYVDLLKRNPGLRRTDKGKRAMQVYNITEADLGR